MSFSFDTVIFRSSTSLYPVEHPFDLSLSAVCELTLFQEPFQVGRRLAGRKHGQDLEYFVDQLPGGPGGGRLFELVDQAVQHFRPFQ